MPGNPNTGVLHQGSHSDDDTPHHFLHKLMAKSTHFIDENLRLVQFSIYGLAVLGGWRLLHSVRAFSQFRRIEDIPGDFIRKNVRLLGRVHKIDTAPIINTSSTAVTGNISSVNEATFPSNASPTVLSKTTPRASADSISTSFGETLGASAETDVTHKDAKIIKTTTPTEANTTDSAKEINQNTNRPNNDGYRGSSGGLDFPLTHSEIAEVDATLEEKNLQVKGNEAGVQEGLKEEMFPLYLMVQHQAVVPLSHHSSQHLLQLQLAAVQVTRAGVGEATARLADKKVWFRPLYRDTSSGALVCSVTNSKFPWRRCVSGSLVRDGLAVAVPGHPSLQDIAPILGPHTWRDVLRRLYTGATEEQQQQQQTQKEQQDQQQQTQQQQQKKNNHLQHPDTDHPDSEHPDSEHPQPRAAQSAVALRQDQGSAHSDSSHSTPACVPAQYTELQRKLERDQERAKERGAGVWSREPVPLHLPLWRRLWARYRRERKEG